MSRTIRNILIRGLTEEDNLVIREIMRDTGCFQASKAIMRMAYSYLRMPSIIKRQADQIRGLEAENSRLRSNAQYITEAIKRLDEVLSKDDSLIVE